MPDSWKPVMLVFCVLLPLLPLLAACSSSESSPPTSPEMERTGEPTPASNVEIVIGNLTDLTGVAASAVGMVNMALEDMVAYYNLKDLVPGVELKVVTFDGQFDPSRDIPGYEWLKREGADMIFTPFPSTATTLKQRAADDGMVLFSLAPSEEALNPPGHVFCIGSAYGRELMYTLLDWIANNDADFPAARPAKLGGAYWKEDYGEQILAGAEEYASAHPAEYEWVGGYLTGFTFSWSFEVEELKKCDYVLPPVPMNYFVEQYRQAGYKGKFIGTDAHIAFLDPIHDAGLWDEVNGMLIVNVPHWWNEEGEVINLIKLILHNRRPNEAADIIRSGNGYLAATPLYVMLEIVRNAVDEVGRRNFNSQALYDAATSYSMVRDGYEVYSLTEDKRSAVNYLGMYELSAAEQDVMRIGSDWIPVRRSP